MKHPDVGKHKIEFEIFFLFKHYKLGINLQHYLIQIAHQTPLNNVSVRIDSNLEFSPGICC